jgi:hypothetical protein
VGRDSLPSMTALSFPYSPFLPYSPCLPCRPLFQQPPFPFPAAVSFSNRPLFTTTLPFLSSRAKPRDLQFRETFVEMFFDRARRYYFAGSFFAGSADLEMPLPSLMVTI